MNSSPSPEQFRIAFVLPGVGAARLGMGADLAVAFPALRAVAGGVPRGWIDAMWPPQPFGEERERQQAALDAVATQAVAVASLTMAQALAAVGVIPHAVIGCGSPLLAVPGAADALMKAGVEGAPFILPDELADWAADTGSEERFTEEVRALADEGVEIFVEVGPASGLADLVDRVLGDTPHLSVAVDRPEQHGVTSLLHAIAQLAEAGVEVDLAALHAGRDSQPERWTEPSKRPGWIVNGHFVRTASGQSLPKGLNPASEAPEFHIAGGPAGRGNGSGNGNGNGTIEEGELAAVAEYLRIVHGVMSTASEIVRSRSEITDTTFAGEQSVER